MKINIYSIYDTEAKAYNTPFFMHNHALALRAFSDQVNSDNENQIANHPEQFILYHIGTYNDEVGEVEKLDLIKSLGRGIELKEPTEINEMQQALKEMQLLLDEYKKISPAKMER
jgi:hypothetical protein